MSDLSSLHGEQVASSRGRRHSLAGDLAIRSRSVSTGDLLKWVAVELATKALVVRQHITNPGCVQVYRRGREVPHDLPEPDRQVQ